MTRTKVVVSVVSAKYEDMYNYIHCLIISDSSLKTPLVAELPLEMQGYRLIDSFGPTGVPFQVYIDIYN